MAYIGKSPSTKFSAAAKVDTFTGDGSTTTFDLANIIPAGGENGLQVFVNNVRQKPGASNAFTVGNDGSGDLKRITFTEAPAASDEIYVITTFEATNITEIGDGTVTTAKIADDAVTSAKIVDGAIVNADINASAAIADSKLATLTTASKVNVSALSAPGSTSLFLRGDRSYAAIPTDQIDANAFNISLLGFKMAVNEGLTVFNLVDGIVDEFHDESGTDESEGSNDLYNASEDLYVNSTQPQGVSTCISAGFSMTAITEPDTSTAGTNPTHGTATFGTFTVPSGVTSVCAFAWGAGGGRGSATNMGGGGGGFTTGKLAVTGGQVLTIAVGEGGGTGSDNAAAKGIAPSGTSNESPGSPPGPGGGSGPGGAASGISDNASISQPTVLLLAAGGGSGGGIHGNPNPYGYGGPGGALIGNSGNSGPDTSAFEQTNKYPGPGGSASMGGGGSQTTGGQAGTGPQGNGQSGSALQGGNANTGFTSSGAGGGGYYGGGGAGYGPNPPNGSGGGGGGSSYYGHPGTTCGSTEDGGGPDSNPHVEGGVGSSGGHASPLYDPLIPFGNPGYPSPTTQQMGAGPPAATGPAGQAYGGDGYILLSVNLPATTTSTTLVSTAFSASSVPTTSRIVVFEENVDTPTLNTDIIASISRDGGSTYTNATLSDSGYVTGSSGQRILTGQATISGQPSGQSMRWKLALANNAVKIHGVSLQWS